MDYLKPIKKITALLCLLMAGVLHLYAQQAPLHYRHAAGTLDAIAEDFGRVFKVQLAYTNEELAAIKVAAASYEAANVGELLNKVLAPGGFGAKASGNTWVIRKSEPVKKLPTMLLKGDVKEGITAVAGASVIIKQYGVKPVIVLTDDNGNFSKALPELDGIVEITAIGYQPVMRKFNSNSVKPLVIRLERDETQMQDVVVTALGIKRAEKSLGYATTTINNSQLTDAVASNWTDALSGKVAGLNLVRSNSGPTGSNKIILRGENNLTGNNEALIVVDGVVINTGSGRRTGVSGEATYGTGADNMPADYGASLNDLNPEDIETVTVLKGPGAAALYGQRAANGAIVITTKTGASKKHRMGVNFTSNVNIEQPNRWPDMQYEYGIGLDGQSDYEFGKSANSTSSSAYGPRFDGQLFHQLDPVTQMRAAEATPWVPYKNKLREFFTTAHTVTNTVSVDGGSDKTSARFSMTNVQNKWIIPNTGYKRNTVALSVNSKVTDQLQITSKINYTNKFSDNLPGAGYGNQSIMYWFIFWQPNADLDWLKDYWRKGQENKAIFYPYSSYPENPYAVAHEFLNASNRHVVTGNVQATYTFSKALSLMVRTSLDLSHEQRSQRRPYDAGSKFQKGSFRTQSLFNHETTTDFLLKYAKKINSDFEFSITAGGSALRNNFNKNEVRADSLTYPGVYTLANAAGPLVTIPYRSQYGINSFYGMMTAGYKEFLFADITARQDWNSVLATRVRTENTGFLYPSANISFIASEVMKLPAQVNYAKLRFSASGVGSGETVSYRTSNDVYNSAGSLWSGGLANLTTLNNPNLRPLRTITYEAGMNMKLFKNRVGIDVAVYAGVTKDQILDRIVDRASGYARQVINLGKVSNRGVEVALNATPVVTRKGFKWNTNIVFSTNRNTIKELADSSVVLQNGPIGGGQIVAKRGGSMGDLYGRGYVRSPEGDIVYDNRTGFALISPEVLYLGNTIPKWRLGVGNDFSYKNFRLSVLFDVQYGGVAHSLMHHKMAEQGKLSKTLPGRYNGITGNGVIQEPDGKYRQNDVIAADIDEYYRSHWGIDNAEGNTFRTDFIKFREARFDYTLSPKLMRKLGLARATVGVYGRNLFIWSPWPMFDPEFGTIMGSDIIQGFEIGQFPSTRTLGCNLVIAL